VPPPTEPSSIGPDRADSIAAYDVATGRRETDVRIWNITWKEEAEGLEGYSDYMAKEIREQPAVLRRLGPGAGADRTRAGPARARPARDDRETAVGSGHGDGTWRLATRPHGRKGIGSRRRRFELDLDGWRRRPEGVRGKRGTAGQAESRYGNHDDTTHVNPSLLCGKLPQSPLRP